MGRTVKVMMMVGVIVASVMSFSVMMARIPAPIPVPVAESDLPVISAANAGQLKLLSSLPVQIFYGLSQDSSLLFYLDGRDNMQRWDIAAGKNTITVPVGAGQSAFSADGKTIYHLNADSVELWDATSGTLANSVKIENAPQATSLLKISPSGMFVGFVDISGGTIQVWDARTGKSLFTIPFDISSGGYMLFSPDNQAVLLYNSAGAMALVSTSDGSVRWTQHSDNINAGQLVFSPNGQKLAIVGAFGATDLVDTTSGKVEATISGDRGNTSYSHGASFSPDNQTLAILMDTGAGNLFDLSGTIQGRVQTDTDTIMGYGSSPVFSPDGTLVTLQVDAGIRVADVTDAKVVGKLDVDPTELAVRVVQFTPDGKLLVLFCVDNTAGNGPTVVQLWGVAGR